MDSTTVQVFGRYLAVTFIILFGCRCITDVRAQRNATEKVCRGTNYGLAHAGTGEERHAQYRRMYTGCTYVDGNVELVFLDHAKYELDFLKDITEITGYLLVVSIYADRLPLTALRVIRGRTLFEDHGRYYSVWIANNFDPDNEATVGLRELQLVSLHEIVAGDVFFHKNSRLCFVDTINWSDIMAKNLAVVLNETWSTRDHSSGCSCDSSCMIEDPDRSKKARCWGVGPTMCQKYTRLKCSRQCDNRCMGPDPSDCCHRECAAGCTGPTNADCLACKAFDNGGRCEAFCPPELIYSEKVFANVPNPDAKYSYGTLCVDKCPTHLIADHGACVHECPPGRVPGNSSKCVDCDGPCPKQCPGTGEESVTSMNIQNFTGCTIIKGNIKILANALDSDVHEKIGPMNVSQLSVFETVQEVSDFVQIQLKHPNFTNLDFFRNLRVINGRILPTSNSALEIYDTSLTTLDLKSLHKVHNGGIAVLKNWELCYANYIDWKRFVLSPSQKLRIDLNRNQSLCVLEGSVCSPECSTAGCWGPRDDECLSCANFSLEHRCLPSCNAVPNVYQSGPNTCSHCHPECTSGCNNALASSCVDCLHVKDGPFCVAECPPRKYADVNRICQFCHDNCGLAGCTGPQNTVGVGGCNSCDIVRFADNGINISMCQPEGSACEDGYFKQRLSAPANYPSLDGKLACKRCHPLCRTCDGFGLSFCKSCVHYHQVDRCVQFCDDDHYLNVTSRQCLPCDRTCSQCSGPAPSQCLKCRLFAIYRDLGKDDLTQPFNCTDKCPPYAPYTFIIEDANGQVMSTQIATLGAAAGEQMTLCVAEDYTSLGRTKTILIAVLIPGIIIIICVVVVIIVVSCRQRALAEKKKMETAARIMGVETEMQPLNVSGIEPDRAVLRLTKESELRRGGMIGAGAFGTVYRGWWVPENESVKIPVAIKILTSGNVISQNSEMLEEARIMASVNNKYCVRILGVCMTERMMIITQLMSHGCLRNYVRENRAHINSQMMLNWCTQIAKGMEYLESRGIIHRDLAARNVLVQRPEHLRITDFGLAKLLGNKQEMSSASAEKMPIKWLALECIRNRIYSHKTDVWSYGVLLWELFTYGETPYGNLRAVEIPCLLEKGERLPQPSMCTIDVFMLMIKCWMLDADSRPSFKNLADEFEKMAMDPKRYIVIEDDSNRRLISVSSDPDAEARDLLRTFSLPSDAGPEHIVTADEYLQPRSVNGTAVPVGNQPPPTPPRGPSAAAAPEPESCRRRSRRGRFLFRRSNASHGGQTSQRYTSDPCKKSLLQQQQQPVAAVPSTPVIHQLPVPLDLIDGAATGGADDDSDNVWVVNNNFTPTRTTAELVGSPPVAPGRAGSRNQSSSSGHEEYLQPRTAHSPPTYMDFPAEDQNTTDEDVDHDTNDVHQATDYVHMSPRSAATFVSNPEYFEDSIFCFAPSQTTTLAQPTVGNGLPLAGGYHGDMKPPLPNGQSDYYNCPPPVKQNPSPSRHVSENQMSRV